MNYARIGIRNLKRRPGRTILTGAMLFIGTTLTIFTVGLQEGTYDEMIQMATSTVTGEFQVLASGYHEKPSLFKTVDHPAEIVEMLKQTPGVKLVSTRVEAAGLLAHGNKTMAAKVTGIDPVREKGITSLENAVTEGEWLAPEADKFEIMLGSGLAQRLGAKVGDEISFVSQAADGSIAAELFTVRGIFATGITEMDLVLAYAPITGMQEVLELGDRVHRVVGSVDNLGILGEVVGRIHPPDGLVVMGWDDLMPELYQSIKADREGGLIFLVIILVVVILGVNNTMMMSVFERTREFGVLMAVGTTPGRIMRQTITEIALLTSSSVGLGMIAGLALNHWLSTVGVPTGVDEIQMGAVKMSEMHTNINFKGNVFFPILIMAGAMIAGFFPARRAAKLNPQEALRRV